MKGNGKMKNQAINELKELRQRVFELEKAEADHKRIAALYTVAQAVSLPLELQELLDNTVDGLVKIPGIDVGLIFLLDMAEKAFILKAYKGATETSIEQVSQIMLTDDEVKNLTSWQDMSAFLTDIFGKDSADRIIEMLETCRVKSFVAVPLWGHDRLLGLLLVASKSRRKFDPDDMELLDSIGRQMGRGMENVVLLQKLSRMATADTITGLYNGGFFEGRLEEEIARSSRNGQECSLIMLEVENFVRYSNSFGNAAGDEVLKKVAQSLRDGTRQMDILCRYADAVFVVILPETDSGTAREVAERLRPVVEKALLYESSISDADLSISSGIVSFPKDGPSSEGLIHRANIALAAAKKRGGNQTCLASDVLSETGGDKRALWEIAEYMDAAGTNTIYAMAAAVDARDHFTARHSRNVAEYAVRIGKALDLSKKSLNLLRTAALLHDIGKIGVSDSIIRKAGPLTEGEWYIMKKHSELGATILSHIPELADCAPVIRHHHEWYDGSGYPDGLRGKEIPLEARIIAVADAYDTMITPRAYRPAISPEEAQAELKRCVNTQFDPAVVLTFINMRY